MKQRLIPLIVTALITTPAWVYFYLTENTLREDRWVATLVTLGFLTAILRMLAETTRWRVQALALMLSLIGLVALFGNASLGLWNVGAGGDWIDAIYRACFIVSSVALLVLFALWAGRHLCGMVRWCRNRRKVRNHDFSA